MLTGTIRRWRRGVVEEDEVVEEGSSEFQGFLHYPREDFSLVR